MNPPNRCRLVLVVPETRPVSVADMKEALSGGDVASVILVSPSSDGSDFQGRCNALVPVIQHAGVAAIVANNTQIAGRCGADGIHLDLPGGDVGVPQLAEAMAKYAPAKIVGAGGVNTRHMALSIGEVDPDYVYFGRLSGDIKPEAHPKLVALAGWWSEMVEVPGICMGGSSLDSIIEVARSGVDFVALSSAIFSHEKGLKQAVQQANAVLDEHAPEFEDA